MYILKNIFSVDPSFIMEGVNQRSEKCRGKNDVVSTITAKEFVV